MILAVFLCTDLLALSSVWGESQEEARFELQLLVFGLVACLRSRKEPALPSATPGFPAEFPFHPGISHGPGALKADHIWPAVVTHKKSLLFVRSFTKQVGEQQENLFLSMKMHYCNSSLPSPPPRFVLFTDIRAFALFLGLNHTS